jgi:predicted RNase H-like nuclease
MFLEGTPRLAAAGLHIPGVRDGDRARVAVEAYPGLAARALTRDSYKSDEARKQTPVRRAARVAMVRALRHDGGPLGLRLEGRRELLAALVEDATGDCLDALLAALQAAWCWRRRARNFGLPRETDPLEGWIATARPG